MQDYTSIFNSQRAFFNTGATLDVAFRIEQLTKLKQAIQNNEAKLYEAIAKDLNKSELETYICEIALFYKDVDLLIKKLPALAKTKKIKTNILNAPAKTTLRAHPYGQACIISPWNYPYQLTFMPLAASIAAGNTSVIKPSELSSHCTPLMAEILNQTFASDYVHCIEGGVDETTALLKNPFDKIFFTGSTQVGASIVKATADYLPSLTLELGGKSPCIVFDDANIKQAAKKIVWGKMLNSGQSCTAPDYILVQESVKNDLIQAMIKEATARYGKSTLTSDDVPCIINERHYQRLKNLIPDENVVFGGHYDDEKRKIDFTLVDNITPDHPLMQSELFGPMMPVICFKDMDAVLSVVRKNPNPLALYVFTESQSVSDSITSTLNFGGATLNDTMVHVTNPNVPFGGVGASGVGAYHGVHGFNDFSHFKPVMKKSSLALLDIPLRYAPYTKFKLKQLKRIMSFLN